MATSAPGSSQRGFTLIELLIVVAIIAVAAGVMTLALRDGDANRLQLEGERLVALLEMARAESRVSGGAVRWVPAGAEVEAGAVRAGFRFIGLHKTSALPSGWLQAETRAQVSGAPFVTLGPEPMLPAQRVLLSLGEQRLEITSDGLAPFAVTPAAAPP